MSSNLLTARRTSPPLSRRISRLTISWQGKEGISTLTIIPRASITNTTNNINSVEIDVLNVNLNIPNGPGFKEQQPFTNYTKSVNAALRTLIEAQDEQFPLTTKTNTP